MEKCNSYKEIVQVATKNITNSILKQFRENTWQDNACHEGDNLVYYTDIYLNYQGKVYKFSCYVSYSEGWEFEEDGYSTSIDLDINYAMDWISVEKESSIAYEVSEFSISSSKNEFQPSKFFDLVHKMIVYQLEQYKVYNSYNAIHKTHSPFKNGVSYSELIKIAHENRIYINALEQCYSKNYDQFISSFTYYVNGKPIYIQIERGIEVNIITAFSHKAEIYSDFYTVIKNENYKLYGSKKIVTTHDLIKLIVGFIVRLN